jgi:hypothetical protein
MTKAETLKMQSKMRRLCRVAIRKFAADHQLKIEKTKGGLAIYSPDRNFHVSEKPHGHTRFNCEFEPGNGCQADWNRFFADGVVLSYSNTKGYLTGDNFNPNHRQITTLVVKDLRKARA